MPSYSVSVTDTSQSAIDPESVRQFLQDAWEDVEFYGENGQPESALNFAVPTTAALGFVSDTRTFVNVEGSVEDAAVIALGVRRIVPVHVELVFFDEAYTFDVRLTSGTTVQDLVRAATQSTPS